MYVHLLGWFELKIRENPNIQLPTRQNNRPQNRCNISQFKKLSRWWGCIGRFTTKSRETGEPCATTGSNCFSKLNI
jgi:hypothetical protein